MLIKHLSTERPDQDAILDQISGLCGWNSDLRTLLFTRLCKGLRRAKPERGDRGTSSVSIS